MEESHRHPQVGGVHCFVGWPGLCLGWVFSTCFGSRKPLFFLLCFCLAFFFCFLFFVSCWWVGFFSLFFFFLCPPLFVFFCPFPSGPPKHPFFPLLPVLASGTLKVCQSLSLLENFQPPHNSALPPPFFSPCRGGLASFFSSPVSHPTVRMRLLLER